MVEWNANIKGVRPMKIKTIANPVININLSSYRSYIDLDWAKRMLLKTENTKIETAIGDLILSWRFADGVQRLPWLMIESMKSFAIGELNGNMRYRNTYAETVVKGLKDKLASRMETKLKHNQLTSLHRAVAKIEREAFDILNHSKPQAGGFAMQYWKMIIQKHEFQFSVLGSQRMGYCSLFFAYEDFVASVIGTKEKDYNSRKHKIHKAFPKYFGNPLADYCWKHEDVNLARMVRNDLVHNGGRLGKCGEQYPARFVEAKKDSDLLMKPDLFFVSDGKIEVTPWNSRYLFGVLKERVTKIVEQVF
jgi:hypothetical protein